MKLDAALHIEDLADAQAAAEGAERLGFDGVWTSDTSHNPMFPLVLAAEHTDRLRLGTAILVAFARSPMDVAYQAWDIARFSDGRFVLGLGTQVSAHITRRFAMSWPTPPVDAFREYIAAVRAIWHSWQTGERLNFRGRFYKITLMAPIFDPGPIAHPAIPIYTAGVNERMCRLAGEVSDGFHAHPFHTGRYLAEVVLPAISEGASGAGRTLADVELSSTVFVATGRDQPELDRAVEDVRQQVAFYASTPTYARVLETHGWGSVQAELGRLAARKRWSEMAPLVTDEMLGEFAIVCSVNEVAARLRAKYDGVLDRVTIYRPFRPAQDSELWAELVNGLGDDQV